MATDDQKQAINIADYYNIITRHKWIIVISVVIAFIITLIHNSRTVPIYRASSIIIIDSETNQSLLQSNRYFYETYLSQTLTFNTHFELVKSRPVMERVIKKLNLDKNIKEEKKETKKNNPIQKFFSQFRLNIFFMLNKSQKAPIEEDKLAGLVNSIQGMIDIEPVEDTRLLKIKE